MSRQAFNTNKYNKAYNALFPASTAIDPMTGLAYPGGVFIGGYGPPLAYNVAFTHPTYGVPTLGGNPDVTKYLQGPVKPANPNENGWKDTFVMYPGEVTTVIARWAPTNKPASTPASQLWFDFDPSGHGYVWHCHIIDHEDNEMMRPYNVTPNTNAVRSLDKPLADQIASGLKPSEFILSQNYPNPFNPTTEIRFSIPEDVHAKLTVFNALGQEVQTLIDQVVPQGNHTVKLDATALASGVYYYRLSAGAFSQVKKMMLMK
jgi:hypothetical protein